MPKNIKKKMVNKKLYIGKNVPVLSKKEKDLKGKEGLILTCQLKKLA